MSSYHLVLCACILVTSAVPPPSTREYGSWDEYDRDARRTRADGGRVMPLVRDARTNTSSTLPLFVVIGAQKCGTTFLRTSLAQHPLLTPARGYRLRCGGEVHYFDYRAGTVAKDAAAALANETARGLGADKLRRARAKAVRQKYARDHCSLPGCNARAQFVFDTTPRYMVLSSERIALMRDALPDAHLVALVRDPVSRFRSELAMEACKRSADVRDPRFFDRLGFHRPGGMRRFLERAELRGLNESAEPGASARERETPEKLALFRGLYSAHLRRFLAVYPREQLHVLRAERLFADPLKEIDALLRAMGVPISEPLSTESNEVFRRPSMCNVSLLLNAEEEGQLRNYYESQNSMPETSYR